MVAFDLSADGAEDLATRKDMWRLLSDQMVAGMGAPGQQELCAPHAAPPPLAVALHARPEACLCRVRQARAVR